jgi:hypothetical protein
MSDHLPRTTKPDTFRASACDGKVKFETYAQAREVGARGTRRGKPRQVYHCPFCYGYHLGTRPVTLRQSRIDRQRRRMEEDE